MTSLSCFIQRQLRQHIWHPLQSTQTHGANCDVLKHFLVQAPSPYNLQHVRLGLVHPRCHPPNPHLRGRLHLLLTIPRQTEGPRSSSTLIIQPFHATRTPHRELSRPFRHRRLGEVEIPIGQGFWLTEWGVRTAAWRYYEERVRS